MKSIFIVVAATGLLTLSVVQCTRNYDIYYQWKVVEYDLPSNIKLNSSEYIQENNFIATMTIFENRMWITTPRYRRGVPITLSTLPYKHVYFWWEQYFTMYFGWKQYFPLHEESPKLKPFPSYEMNAVGDCNALQLVQSIEIDQFGRLWVIDVGRVNVLEEIDQEGSALNLCPAKLVLFDVTKGRSDKIFTYIFPDEVAPKTTNLLKDLQVACTTREDCWVYISDIALSRLVVYDHKNRQSWTAEHPSMKPDKINFFINGVPQMAAFGINGQGLAPKQFNFSYLHFSPLGSTTLYKIETDILKNSALKRDGTLQQNDVTSFGEKSGQSDGFAMSSTGCLYYGNLPDSSVQSTDTDPELMHIQEQRTVAQSAIDILWPDNFAFDGKGKLALTTTKFHLFVNRMINPMEFNYRVIILRHTGKVFAYNV